MQYNFLGNSGQVIPAITLGTATFGGSTEFFQKWGKTDKFEARELIETCLEYGCNAFDTADCYSLGDAEKILGEAIKGVDREKLFISTKTGMWMSDNPNDIGTSRTKILKSIDESLKRLGLEYIDLFYLHCYDAKTSHLEVLQTLNELIRIGKIRYFGVSNYSAWHLMKMLSVADKYNFLRPVAHQAYYSLAAREYEYELMPLALEEKIATLAWSPLSGAKLSGKITRNNRMIDSSRLSTDGQWDIDENHLYNITDALEEVSKQTGYTMAQIALKWLLSRPSVSSLVIGSKNSNQLKENLLATKITLEKSHIELLDRASQPKPIYPYWHQRATVPTRDPAPIKLY